MSYVVKCDDEILYKKYLDEYDLLSTNFELVDNEAGSFVFTFSDTHPMYNYIVPKKSKIKVYKNGRLIWLGRAVDISDGLDNDRTVTVEGCLSFLRDSIMRPFNFSGAPEDFFNLILQQHNDQVSEDQKIYPGICTVTDPNDTIVRSSTYYLNTNEVVEEKLLSMGGHLVFTFNEDEDPILNWLSDIENYTTQKIEFGSNLVSYEKSLLYSDFYTACIPLGAKDEDDKRLTIETVNNGLDYVVNSELANLYGIFFAPTSETTWDDVTIAANLKTKGTNWLANAGIKYKDSVELEAEDISFLPDVDVTDFEFMSYVQFVTSTGANISYLIVDFSADILDEYSISLVLSKEESKYIKKSLVDMANRINYNSAENIRNVEAQVVSKSSAQSLIETVIRQSTYITQAAGEIVLAALSEYSQTSDLANAVSSLQSQLSIMANEVSLSFANIETIINNQSTMIDEQSQLFENTIRQYNSWFRFIPASQSTNAGLVIGQSNNPIQVKLESDVMYFCTDPDNAEATAIAWYAGGEMHVHYANLQNLTLGSAGRLIDFRIVGTGANTCVLISGRLS